MRDINKFNRFYQNFYTKKDINTAEYNESQIKEQT